MLLKSLEEAIDCLKIPREYQNPHKQNQYPANLFYQVLPDFQFIRQPKKYSAKRCRQKERYGKARRI